MRKLASIQRVLNVEPIEGADKIEKLTVLGWTLVSQKGNFKTNDLCIYVEIDSVFPDLPQFEFMRESKFRLKSKRLRGVLSQGLALPWGEFLPDAVETAEPGMDVTEVMHITKWEPVQSQAKEVAGPFPTHLFPKTDETRLQSVPEILEELRGVECYVSMKMDGQSLTFARHTDWVDRNEGELGPSGAIARDMVCMRNNAIKDIEGSPHWDMARKLKIFDTLPSGFAVQGEYCGLGIQANRIGLKDRTFFAFQVFDISKQKFLDFPDFVKFCAERNIPTVPIENPSMILDHTLEQLLKMAEGKYTSGHPREGIVIRPVKEQNSRVLSAYEGRMDGKVRASFKVINNEFLLKVKE